MKNETLLTYPCSACSGIATHATGPHYLDSGTRLYCNICGGETVVVFQSSQQAVQPVSRTDDINVAGSANEKTYKQPVYKDPVSG
ncbi:MAG: hypothetical protein GY797_27165 [Deltaproteobacteria bacterium]|nr:hypothetical protein [Deltaproteobacteria bacterium]